MSSACLRSPTHHGFMGAKMSNSFEKREPNPILRKSSLRNWFPQIHFTVLNHSGTQNHRYYSSRGQGCCSSQQQALVSFRWCCFYRHAECKTCEVMEAVTYISKEHPEGQATRPWKNGVWSCWDETKSSVETTGCLKRDARKVNICHRKS